MAATTVSSVALIEKLFVPDERWGWEYREPEPLQPSPETNERPAWQEPPEPDVSALLTQREQAKGQLPKRLAMVGALWILLSIGSAALGFLVLLVGLTVVVGLVAFPAWKIKTTQQEATQRRELAFAQFQQAEREWQAQIDKHDERERQRQAAALLWHPLRLQSCPSRVDVFGGTGDGWASLVATLGSSLMATGSGILLVDFSEEQVGGGLAALASTRGFSVSQLTMPAELARLNINILGGCSPDEVAELVAESVHTMRQSGDNVDLRALDAELLVAVAERLDEPPTFTRLVAGLKLLRRTYEAAESGPLTAPEIARLTSYLDTFGHTERVQHELQFLTSVLDLLAREETGSTVPNIGGPAGEAVDGRIWPGGGLAVISTSSRHQRRKDLIDRIVFHRVLHELRSGGRPGTQDVLVIAGADHVGRESLEAMARQARIAGVRLILLLEHLRGDLEQLLGGSDSAAVLMRLGNTKEADAAANFIGRGHKFVLSQLTDQTGKTFTEGTAESRGWQEGVSYTEGRSGGSSHSWSHHGSSGEFSSSGGSSSGWSTSVTDSRAETWQHTVNQSMSDSQTTGTTRARVYEFAVEPTAIQSLPPTAFVLVEAGRSGRRVVMGDCNPGITLLERVADTPQLT
ncbi:MAG: hypothetical protein ACRDRS_06715 [Pseudonocardiaceae bacterium]